MRFPFTFMGLLSLGFAAWIVLLFTLHRAGWLELVVAGLMVAFGAYVLYRRLAHGRSA
jgi:hypothetical protein